MISIRCTARAAKALGVVASTDVPPGTSPLGDWYVNLVPTSSGGAFLFMNELNLLAVVVPRDTFNPLNTFVARVANLLSMIGVPNARIERELEHFRDVRVGKTASKRVLGVLNDLAWRLQEAVERTSPRKKLSLSDFELWLAKMPQATLEWRTASELATSLLDCPTAAPPN